MSTLCLWGSTFPSPLGLSTNLLHEGIPFSISKLKQLELLNLKNNQLTGPIPSTLTQIADLKTPFRSNPMWECIPWHSSSTRCRWTLTRLDSFL
ncbi:LRR receptor-like serine/threonine-protein kinase ERL1 isoform X2 [Rhododendron vialii]|uniref:LRR receptor-like serine/threonine-protein kinase ERL1 isoform X2 n=1 Tax=Rhododendron vialii TaxID=182163 RepID=UPI00265DFB3A|nr:LRR receptor-like serine/threonine-protein kinase ERL1 isoform X2 [Rhododendron vialii]